mmetsp:Transcript_12555/g.30828  ORF Transcript_12555/g.30828 Transcript_12555/m.30828 type:complete len:318 (-) Transcript_12555:35-988(-)
MRFEKPHSFSVAPTRRVLGTVKLEPTILSGLPHSFQSSSFCRKYSRTSECGTMMPSTDCLSKSLSTQSSRSSHSCCWKRSASPKLTSLITGSDSVCSTPTLTFTRSNADLIDLSFWSEASDRLMFPVSAPQPRIPKNIKKIENVFPNAVRATQSPYPTVAIVAMASQMPSPTPRISLLSTHGRAPGAALCRPESSNANSIAPATTQARATKEPKLTKRAEKIMLASAHARDSSRSRTRLTSTSPSESQSDPLHAYVPYSALSGVGGGRQVVKRVRKKEGSVRSGSDRRPYVMSPEGTSTGLYRQPSCPNTLSITATA